MSFGLGDAISAAGILLSLFGCGSIALRRMDARGKAGLIFLMTWSVPYAIGYFCDAEKRGPLWVRWHLLDISYVQWATTLGVAIYAVVTALCWGNITQRAIMIATLVSFVLFIVMGYAWEIGQTLLAAHSAGLNAIDWGDYSCLAIGSGITAVCIAIMWRTSSRSATS